MTYETEIAEARKRAEAWKKIHLEPIEDEDTSRMHVILYGALGLFLTVGLSLIGYGVWTLFALGVIRWNS